MIRRLALYALRGAAMLTGAAALGLFALAELLDVDGEEHPDPAAPEQPKAADAHAHRADVDGDLADADRVPLDELLRSLTRPGVRVEAVRVAGCACCGALVVGDRVHCRTCVPVVDPLTN